jgi:hypothetical protein
MEVYGSTRFSHRSVKASIINNNNNMQYLILVLIAIHQKLRL